MGTADTIAKTSQMELKLPQDIRETGIRRGTLEDLALKILYLQGEMSLSQLAEHLCLGFGVAEELFEYFRRERLCEVKGIEGSVHRIKASAEGRQRAVALLSLNQYAGPAPVSLEDYSARVRRQSIAFSAITQKDVKRAFGRLVVDEMLVFRIGTAVSSGRSLFLYGSPGTGKTTLATALPAIFEDSVWIPYAVEVDDQIITVFDPGVHFPSSQDVSTESDKRWVLCRRPCVITGGEFSSEMLDLQIHPVSHYCTAPLHMKASNGIFIIDDFGRQRVKAHELLNRWMTPLDRRVDFLTLPGGRKFEVPFDAFVVFATNLDPLDLADAAFLRRIPHKVKVDYAKPEQFIEILRRECEEVRSITVEPGVYEYAVQQITEVRNEPLRHCYARDLVLHILAASRYLKARPELTKETVEWACENCFLDARKSAEPT